MQKLIIFIMAAFLMIPPLTAAPTSAQAQVTVRPHHSGYYGRPHYRHHRYSDRRHYRNRHYSRPYYGHNRRYHRRNNDAAIAAGIAGLAVGAIVAGSAANNTRYRASSDHHAYCHSRYRSYDARSGTFVGYDGRRHYCRSPY